MIPGLVFVCAWVLFVFVWAAIEVRLPGGWNR